jgi:hypothetical protein
MDFCNSDNQQTYIEVRNFNVTCAPFLKKC